MAVTEKRNEEYWALKTRTKKWGVFVLFIFPLILVPTLTFGGTFIGFKLFSTDQSALGFILGGVLAATICFTLWQKKIGFLFQSKEKCQSCGKPLAEYRMVTFRPYDICRWCGNDNRINLNA